jgi:hypothetical protein
MALPDFETSAEFTELERLALRYAVAMTATPVELAGELFDALRAHFDARQLVDLTSAIAWENYRARFNHAFACEAEGFSEGAFCPLPAPAQPRGAGTLPAAPAPLPASASEARHAPSVRAGYLLHGEIHQGHNQYGEQ